MANGKLLLACLTIACAVAGCAQMQQQRLQEQAVAINSSNRFQLAAMAARCRSQIDNDGDLAPIRDKVELWREDNLAPAPFGMASNAGVPTEEERKALAKWADMRIACQKEQNSFWATTTLPPRMERVQFEKFRSFDIYVAQQVNDLIVALHAGKLTYGEFAKKRVEIGTAGKAAQREYVEALQIADYQRRMQEAQLAEQRQQAAMQAWAAYM